MYSVLKKLAEYISKNIITLYTFLLVFKIVESLPRIFKENKVIFSASRIVISKQHTIRYRNFMGVLRLSFCKMNYQVAQETIKVVITSGIQSVMIDNETVANMVCTIILKKK